jgi:hypothetical protein
MRSMLERRSGLVFILTAALLAASPGSGRAQAYDRDARIPDHGALWIELSPSWEIWNDEFALGSDTYGDGSKEPLHSNYEGSIVERLFPGMDPLLADLNRDAVALGYDSLAATDVSLGDLDYGRITKDVRRVPLGLSFGLFNRVSVDVLVPIVRGTAETSYAYDSTTANFVPASTVFPAPESFFGPLSSAQQNLAGLIDGGTLSPEEEAAARALLSGSDEFALALEDRVSGRQLLPTAPSTAGIQLLDRYAAISDGYTAFGLTLPTLALPDSATSADLQPILGAAPIGVDSLIDTTRGWDLGEIEIGLRVLLFDTFAPITPVDEGSFRTTRKPDLRGSGTRFRTTVGARLRFPVSDADAAPYLVPSSAMQQPVGDGQTDVEFGVWQDAQFGAWLWIVGSARYTLQLADELVMRVRDPDHPFAYTAQERTVNRNLGDVFELRLSPRFRMNETMSLGIEYKWRSKGSDEYTGDGVPDPSPLASESSQTRHRLGIGAYYRTTPRFAAGIANFPIEMSIVWQGSIAGGGGLTPASDIMTLNLRVPVQLF